MDDMTEARACVECSRTNRRKDESATRSSLRKSESRNGGDLLCTGRVTKPVGNGTCGEVVTPRCVSRLSAGRVRNTNRLMRVCGLKCHHLLHDLPGGSRTDSRQMYGLLSGGGARCSRAAIQPSGVRS
jgi:hypothetical protein